jgi:predicted ABC-type ATPase
VSGFTIAKSQLFGPSPVHEAPPPPFLREAAASGYTVVLCFIGLDTAERSEERVAMRVLQGGHDVPSDKLPARFPRTLENLRRAIHALPHVLVFDNTDLARPFRRIAVFRDGRQVSVHPPVPAWFAELDTDISGWHQR